MFNKIKKDKKKLQTYAHKIIPGLSGLLGKRPEMYLPGGNWPTYYKKAKGITILGIDKKKYTQSQKQWNLMMNNLPNDINFEKLSVNEIAKKYKLPINDLQMYLNKWEKKRLISREI